MILKDDVEKQLEEMLLEPNERCLMELLFGGEYTEEKMHLLLEDLDIETANQNFLLMLSCLGYMKGWELFPAEIVPRLKGVHRYYQVLNSKGMPWLIRQIQILSDAGIPVMLIKGMAMRAYYASDTPRIMWDYDIAVPEKQYRKAVELLCQAGGVLKGECLHSSAITNGKEEIDLHRWIFKANEERKTDFWERAIYFSFFGIEVCVPSPVDMFIHQLDTHVGDFFVSESFPCRIKWLYDCRRIVSFIKEFDLTYVADRAKRLHVINQVQMILPQFIYYFPELVKENSFNKAFMLSDEYYKWLKNGQRCKKELKKYRAFCVDPNVTGIMKPIYFIHLIRLELAWYHFYKWRMKQFSENLNLWQYFRETRNIDTFFEAIVYLIKYMIRMKLEN